MTEFFITVGYIILALVILLLMVLIHELGHYIAGRKLGFKIKEFAIGFGKAIWSTTNKRGEKISLRIFPLGGYCAFEGEEDEDDVVKPDSFQAQKPWKRIIVYVAGPMFNILSAFIFAFVLLISFGYDIPRITYVDSTDTNVQALEVGDVVYEIGGTEIDFVKGNTFNSLIGQYELGDDIVMTIERNGERMEVIVQFTQKIDEETTLPAVDSEGNPVYLLAINLTSNPYSFMETLLKFIPFTFSLAWLILKGLVMTFTFQIPLNSLSGPIGAIGIIAQQTQANISNLFLLLPLISVNLGVFNLLPIPALDGAHIVFTTVEWIRRKPINRTVEAYIHFFGLIALLAFVIILDILHLVS